MAACLIRLTVNGKAPIKPVNGNVCTENETDSSLFSQKGTVQAVTSVEGQL